MFSCTEIVDIELDSTYTRLVVYGTITTDSIRHEVELTTTTDYFFSEAPPKVDNATVTVSYEGTTMTLQTTTERPGTYFFPEALRGEPGVQYDLLIENVDVDQDGITETYSASTVMPGILPPDSISVQKFISPFFSGYQVAIWSPDPPGVNYYNFKLWRNNELLNKRLSDYTVQPDDLFPDNYISGLPIGFLNDDEEDEVVVPGDTITLEVNSITEEYYNFITEAQNEIFGNNPLFSGPPANVSTNLENGAVGIFTAYSIERVSKIIPVPAFPQ
ncbi:MAG: DUF4249 domain-containing protein [Bacteroidales bacterium]|nr:DUF4249 domain-containing protein [Bacteroidales bacterium]